MTKFIDKETSRPPKRIRGPANDDVGYGKPPRAHRFKSGESGNPKGRPKGAKNETTLLYELLHKKIDIRENGKTRKIIVLEAILRRLVEDAFKGNVKTAAFVLNRLSAIAGGLSEPGISQDDRTVIEAYIRAAKFDFGDATGPS